MLIYPFPPPSRSQDGDRGLLDRSADALCAMFGLADTAQGSWGNWSRLDELQPGHPAFVMRRTADGLSLDTQCWDISGGEACWPTTRIISVSLPWWRRLAVRPEQRCLIPVTACTATLPPRPGGTRSRDGGAAWFGLADEPVFTIAGLWRETGNARCFAMLGCLADAPFPDMPVVIAPADRDAWLTAPWEAVAPLMAPCAPAQLRIGLPDRAVSFYAEEGLAAATGR